MESPYPSPLLPGGGEGGVKGGEREIRVMDKESATTKPMPLEGIRIVEFGMFYVGPVASTILGDLGAKRNRSEEAEANPVRKRKEVGYSEQEIAQPRG